MCQCEDAPLWTTRTGRPSSWLHRRQHHIEPSCPALVKTLLSSISSLGLSTLLPPKRWCDIMDMSGMAARGWQGYYRYILSCTGGVIADQGQGGGEGRDRERGDRLVWEGELWVLMISGASQLPSSPAQLATKDQRAADTALALCSGDLLEPASYSDHHSLPANKRLHTLSLFDLWRPASTLLWWIVSSYPLH